MAKTETVVCDWCDEQLQLDDIETSQENGWFEVVQWEPTKEMEVGRDFCCIECMLSFYR
jgi:hypothetical protein